MLIGTDFFLSHRIYVANSQAKLYFTYNGGPVFDLRRRDGKEDDDDDSTAVAAAPPPPSKAPVLSELGKTAEPKEAEDFARRAASRMVRRDYEGAAADYGRAMALAPSEPRYPYGRALAHLAQHQPKLAQEELDAALKLKPDDLDSLLVRARLRLSQHQDADALSDLDAADAAAAPASEERLPLASLYTEADAFPKAVRQFDLWLAAHGDDGRRASALNGRCWARGLGGLQPERAVADCNAALRLEPQDADILDSLGLAELRRGDLDKAISDYDAVLAKKPKTAWSLYGRGVAYARKGDKARAEADFAASAALEPKLAARAKRLGLGV